MSSHHFVKDQQEPAVFILNTENIGFEQVSPLLEWVPTILVTQECMDRVLSWGIKIDVILASEEYQKRNQHLLQEQNPVKFVTSTSDNHLENGIRYLLSASHFAAHLVGFPHIKALELNAQLELINLTILDGNWKYYPVKSGKLKKWFVESSIHIHGKEGMPIIVKNENGELIVPITYATMVEVPEGMSEIEAVEAFWIGEQIFNFSLKLIDS
jgi:hypothetical protein